MTSDDQIKLSVLESSVASSGKATSKSRVVEKIRSELNIEKWPAIWQPAKSKNRPSLRAFQREVKATDGNLVISRVEVGYTQLGTLTTEEQKMLYVLIKLWEDAGKPDTQVFFSGRGLARQLKKKGWGTNVITAITKSLRKLRTIPIEWINSYHDQTSAGTVIVDRRPFTILGDLRIVERRQDGAVNNSRGYFKFDDHVLTNLQRNYTKPVCIEEFFKLKSEIAQLIYSHVDLMLYDRTRYERRSRELFEDLGLRNFEYNHMYERKRAIDRALKELVGIRLSSGILKAATLEKTVDGKDYKVSFSKTTPARIQSPSSVDEISTEMSVSSVVVNDYTKIREPLTMQAETLVRAFYKSFHAVDKHEPQSKETAQAMTLISQYGFDQAKHILEYAKHAAEASNYHPQTFGGILHYSSRAMAELERKVKSVASEAPQTPKPADVTERLFVVAEQNARGPRRLAALTSDQYQVRFEQARAELLASSSSIATLIRQKHGTKLEQVTVRRRLLEQMEHEVMELLVLGTIADPIIVRQKCGLQNLPL